MFGYIRPLVGELRVREYEEYKAVYCGLCRSMGRNISSLTRLALSYDLVFLAIVRMALTPDKATSRPFRCAVRPDKKRAALDDNETLKYTGSLAAILIYYNLLDDLADTRSIFKKAGLWLALPKAGSIRKKASRMYPGLEGRIKSSFEELEGLQEKGVSPDEAADCFARLLAGAASYGLEEGAELAAESMGTHLGRWIYLIDAVHDIEDDEASGSFNPLLGIYGSSVKFKENVSEIDDSLTMSLYELSKTAALIPQGAFTPVIQNVVLGGLPSVQRAVLSGSFGKKRTKRDSI